MTLRLRVAFEVEVDSLETAKALGVALGWAITNAVVEACRLSESPAARIERGPFEVSAVEAPRHG